MSVELRSDLSVDVVFFFGEQDSRNNLYQLTQWLQPLKRLSQVCSLSVVTVSARAAKVVEENHLDGVSYQNLNESVSFLKELKPKVILYPNKGILTSRHSWYQSAFHVFVSHGESDKAYMSDNTLRYFDYVYCAGDMAIQRIQTQLQSFASKERCIKIGRPQLLDQKATPPITWAGSGDRKTILYAPTSDFLSLTNRYGSVETHGVELVSAILRNEDKYLLIYKPHPLTGSKLPGAIAANQKIISMIQESKGGHIYDQSPFGWQANVSDLLISDVSAVAYDWLATGKPLLITKPQQKEAWLFEEGILGAMDLVDQADSKNICERIESSLYDPRSIEFLNTWSARYYTSTHDEQTGQERFIAETLTLIEKAKDLPSFQGSFPKLKTAETPNGFGRILTKAKLFFKQLFARFTYREPKKYATVGFSLSSKNTSNSVLEKFSKTKSPFLVVNSLSNFLRVKKDWGTKIQVVFTPTVKEVTSLLESVEPEEILYLANGPKNHFGVRHHSIKHVLFLPEHQMGFKADHTLIIYDEIQTEDEKTKNLIRTSVRRPEGWNFKEPSFSKQ
jgi:hypothetical protein